MQTWNLIDTGFNTGAYNMAFDEDLLTRAQARESVPVLRLYGWSPAAVSLGRFQKIEEAVNVTACKELGVDIVKRVTGGRAVLHRDELTYSIIARTDNTLFPNSILETYKLIARGMLAGFGNLGIRAEMVSRGGRNAHLVKGNSDDAACFSSPSWYEILVAGKKIAGSAQRRIPGAFLQHGSILIQYDRSLESRIIRSRCTNDVVTCIRRETGRDISLDCVKQAFVKGFSDALDIRFSSRN